jgi:group II intron reverse transcriptase/maturase
MRDAETTLAIIGGRGAKGLPLDRIYRQLWNPDLYLRAYGRLYRNAGAMTKGTTPETVDGMSMRKIGDIIEKVRFERYRWAPVRRLLIPKGNGKSRPLGIPTWSDKMLQEVIRSILNAYFEPQFSDSSHGFRPGRGCHGALRDIFITWKGTTWFIEGDIKGCFDNIDHAVLMSILREKIQDGRLLNLVEGLLKAGYLEDWDYRPTLSGTPQGGIVSPLLANAYLDRLDKFVERTLIPEYTRGDLRRGNREHQRLSAKIGRRKKKGASEIELNPLRKARRRTPSKDQFDPDYRRLRYVRYADDFLLGFIGPKDEAEEIKGRIGAFLRDELKLELSPEKTLLTHAGTKKARFLGYEVGITTPRRGGSKRGHVRLRLPIQKLKKKIALYQRDGKPIHRSELLNDSDYNIVALYGSEFRGVVQYYAFAENRHWLGHLQWVMESSLIKTLAAKHKMRAMQVIRHYRARIQNRGRSLRCIEAKHPRPGKEPLVARFGGLRLTTDPFLPFTDLPIGRDRWVGTTELVQRLLADTCELCGSRKDVEVHHIRKLADLKVHGRKDKPAWVKTMAARKRKTLVVCGECHTNIHAGRPTGTEEMTSDDTTIDA